MRALKHYLSMAICMVAVAVLIVIAAPAMAQAQLTPGSKCGELATGYKADDRTTILTYQAPGLQVGADGVWVACPVEPPAPPPPKDCPAADHSFRDWAVGEYACSSALASATGPGHPARNALLYHGRTGQWNQWSGQMRGELVERCDDGRRSVVRVSCSPATHCDVDFSTYYDGDTYSIRAASEATRVANGSYAEARSPSDQVVRLLCAAGSFVLAPQCGPQVLQHRGVLYRFAGPAVDVNRRLAIPAADGRKRPNGKPLTLAVGCDFSGRLVAY